MNLSQRSKYFKKSDLKIFFDKKMTKKNGEI